MVKKLISGKKKWVSLLLVTAIITTICVSLNLNAGKSSGMRNMSSLEIVKEMQVGWNLGNTLDATGETGETSWGNPKTTKDMIDKIKAKGFKTVRVPTTWYTHMNGNTIDEAWLDRVQEVVDYVIDNDMYCILNTHHEGSWCKPTFNEESATTSKLVKIWEQVASRFKDYSDYLIFETLNEPRVEGSSTEWTGGTSEYREVINNLNLAAVNTIRKSGGNNSTRHIMVPTHAATSMSDAVNGLVIPNNDSRVIVSLHMYSPYYFAMDANGTSSWGSDSDKSSLANEFDQVYNKFVKNGRAVVIGEWGSINKNNESSRLAHAEYYVKAAKVRGIACIWWDNGYNSTGADTWAIFNRSSLTWCWESVANAILKGFGATSSTTAQATKTTEAVKTTATPTTNKPTATSTVNNTVNNTTTNNTNSNSNNKNYSVDYKILNSWGSGAAVNVSIKNNSSQAINNWSLNWKFPGNQKITSIWGGEYTQSGESVTIKGLSYNSSLPANGQIDVGFCVDYTGSNDIPSNITLN